MFSTSKAKHANIGKNLPRAKVLKRALTLALMAFPFFSANANTPDSNTTQTNSNMVQYLPHGGASLAKIVDSIEQAQTSIDLTYFIMNSCDSGIKTIIDSLRKKSSTVKIRLLLDGWYNTDAYRQLLTELFSESKIELKFFNLLKYSNPTSIVRTHQKFIVVDASGGNPTLITGGRNLTNQYFSLANDHNWMDNDILVKGSSARDAHGAFEALWNSPLTQTFPNNIDIANSEYGSKTNFENWCWNAGNDVNEIRKFLPKEIEKIDKEYPAVKCDMVQFLSDRPDDTVFPKLTTRRILNLIKNTDKNLNILNYSYMPGFSLADFLRDLAKRKVKTEIITNLKNDEPRLAEKSLEQIQSDLKFIKEANLNTNDYKFFVRPYKEAPKEQWLEYAGKSRYLIHAKSWVFDQRTVFIGSFNIDPRSYHTNGESGVIVYTCPKFASQVLKFMNEVKKEVLDSKANNESEKEESKSDLKQTMKKYFLKTPVGEQFL